MKRQHLWVVLAATLLPQVDAMAQTDPAAPAAGKGASTLFDPTPDALMRPLQTDRPGKSFNPFTVDAGHFQLESGVWSYSWDHWSPDDSTTRSTTILAPDLKVGLNDWSELDAVLPLYNTEVTRSRIGNGRQSGQGLGDLQLGGKVNILGNDGDGSHGVGAAFFAELPSGASGIRAASAQYTLALPVVLPLPRQFSITVEPEAGLLDDAVKPGHHGDYQLILNLNRQIPGTTVSAALELALDDDVDHGTGDQNTVDGTLQWVIGRNLQLDAAVYVGLNRSAPDWSPSVGLSFRY